MVIKAIDSLTSRMGDDFKQWLILLTITAAALFSGVALSLILRQSDTIEKLESTVELQAGMLSTSQGSVSRVECFSEDLSEFMQVIQLALLAETAGETRAILESAHFGKC